MNGMVEARSACSRVFGSRIDAHDISLLLICCIPSSFLVVHGIASEFAHGADSPPW
jgi:hypothetical protein